MDEEMIQKMRQQHIDNYRSAIKDIVLNNTNVFIEDIISLIGKPPLDSMDFIQNKFLDIAKKNKIVLNTDTLSKIIKEFRLDVLQCCDEIKEIRIHNLYVRIDQFNFDDFQIFTFYKKDFSLINRKIRSILKNKMIESSQNKLLDHVEELFSEIETDDSKKIYDEIAKYIKNHYIKQILDSFDMKLMVKDTILMNGVKELSDRYLFTLENSRLLKEMD